jgi:hypothetical protein
MKVCNTKSNSTIHMLPIVCIIYGRAGAEVIKNIDTGGDRYPSSG